MDAGLLAALDGERLADKVGFTVQLLTVDDGGSPHAAFLSVGELIALSPADLAIGLHAGSRTTANLRRSRSAAIVAVREGVVVLLRVRCAYATTVTVAARGIACFKARVTDVERQSAPYATGLTGIRFELRDPTHTLPRWEATISALRTLPDVGP